MKRFKLPESFYPNSLSGNVHKNELNTRFVFGLLLAGFVAADGIIAISSTRLQGCVQFARSVCVQSNDRLTTPWENLTTPVGLASMALTAGSLLALAISGTRKK